MKAWVAAVAVAGALVCETSMAMSVDGNQLFTQCQAAVKLLDGEKTDDTLDVGMCIGMIEGVGSSMMIYDHQLPTRLKACFPKDGINNGQAARIILRYLKDNPAKLDQSGTLLTMAAFQQAYPCN